AEGEIQRERDHEPEDRRQDGGEVGQSPHAPAGDCLPGPLVTPVPDPAQLVEPVYLAVDLDRRRGDLYGPVVVIDGHVARHSSRTPSPRLHRLGGRTRDHRHGSREASVSGLVRLEIAGGIGTIRLDRPPVNALNAELQADLRAAAERATASPEVAAVVVYGGERTFAAGADIKELAGLSYVEMAARVGPLSATFEAVARI